jgi:transposase InsO family protein
MKQGKEAAMNASPQLARCRCGTVSLELVGRPMMRATCYCDSCRAAARILGDLPDAPAIVGDDGGTDYTLYRKDRIGRSTGIDHLREHRLTPESPTRRMVADCCNTPLVLDFTKGFWLSFYPCCLTATSADIDTRPKLRALSAPFMARLLLSWAATGFRKPKLDW